MITKQDDNANSLTSIFKNLISGNVSEGKYIETKDASLQRNALTDVSQNKLLEKAVIFQGEKIKLNQLINKDSKRLVDSETLAKLITDQEIETGSELPVSIDYDEDCYIDRTFNHQITIKKEISDDRKFNDLIAKSEAEFSELCQKNSNKNIH